MGNILGRQEPGAAHVGPMNRAIWVYSLSCPTICMADLQTLSF